MAAGLAAIARLDAQLRDVTAEALAASRTAFPEQWAERERRRLERHSQQVGLIGSLQQRATRAHQQPLPLRALLARMKTSVCDTARPQVEEALNRERRAHRRAARLARAMARLDGVDEPRCGRAGLLALAHAGVQPAA